MNSKLFIAIGLAIGLMITSCLSFAVDFSLDKSPVLGEISDFKASDLCLVAENTAQYLQEQNDDKFAVHGGTFNNEAGKPLNIKLSRVEKTLAFICQTYREDVRAQRQSRLHDADFLTSHFDFIRWLPDKNTADSIAQKSTHPVKSALLNNIPNDQIFLTKYYTKLLHGSSQASAKFNQALYSLPFDEVGLSAELAQAKKHRLNRFKYSRQQIIKGALLEKKLAKPLIWLTEEALHDVLLQGTGVLEVDGKRRFFNVHRNNDIAYDYSIGKREQARYWYFIETPEIMGYGQTQASKIAIKPQVTFAGNVAQLGLGKLIMVSYAKANALKEQQPISRMGILADQGGAFDDNLFQLDLLVDSYQGWQDYHQANKHLPDYAKAWLMLLK